MIYIEICIILFLGLILDNTSGLTMTIEKKKRIYIAICLFIIWIMAAFRNVAWVASLHLDAGGYVYIFENDRQDSWASLFTSFRERYILRLSDSDIGYDILNKVIGLITDDFNVFSLIVDALFFIPFGMLLYRYTNRIRHLTLAFIFYIALIQIHLFSGARQMLSLGIDMLAFMCAMKGKKKEPILLIALGLTIHYSSLLSLLPVILIFIDIKPKHLKLLHLVSLAVFPIVFMFPNEIIRSMGLLVGIEKYANYGANAISGGANTFIILIAFLSAFCYFTIKTSRLEEDLDIKRIYATIPFMTLTGPLVHSNGSMIRICMYFYVYLFLLLSYGMDNIFAKRSQKLAYTIVVVALALLVVKGGVVDYHFMWQEF